MGGAAEDPKMWAEREKAIREHTSLKNDNKDATEEYYKQAKSLLTKEGGWSQNLDAAIAQTMLKQEYKEKQIMDAMKSISPCVPALDERAQSYANYTMEKARGLQDTNSAEITVNSTKIGDLRKTLNAHMDEIIAQHTDLSQQRDQVKGAPLTKEQAEKLAASDHVNGADKELCYLAYNPNQIGAKICTISGQRFKIKSVPICYNILQIIIARGADFFMQFIIQFALTPLEYISKFDDLDIKRPALCPRCQVPNSFHKHGKYWRNIVTED